MHLLPADAEMSDVGLLNPDESVTVPPWCGGIHRRSAVLQRAPRSAPVQRMACARRKRV